METIKLTSEQMNKVRKAIHEGDSLLRNECNCGDWEVRLKGLGYFRLSIVENQIIVHQIKFGA